MEINNILKGILFCTLSTGGLESYSSTFDFQEFLEKSIQSGLWQPPKLSPEEALQNRSSLEDFHLDAEIEKLYKSVLAPKSFVLWKKELLEERFFMPSPGPQNGVYNRYLIWALDTKTLKKLAVFRPIETSTGCNTGCSLVVFHLAYDGEGRFKKILQEANRPLEKIGHQTLDQKDLKRAESIVRSLPQALAHVREPTQLADEGASYPPQTWTFYRPTLINGAAYTSYRLYEAALKTANILGTKKWALYPQDFESNVERFYKLSRIEDVSSLLSVFEKYVSQESLPPAIRAASYQFYEALVYFSGMQNQKRLNLVLSKLFSRGNLFWKSKQDLICNAYKVWISRVGGQKFWLDHLQERKKWVPCEGEKMEDLDFLASAAVENSAQIKKQFAQLPARPLWVSKNPALLELWTRGQVSWGDLGAAKNSASILSLRYPFWKTKGDLISRDKISKESDTEEYKNELKRTLLSSSERKQLPESFLNAEAWQKEKIKPLGSFLRKDKAQVLVLFARWCPHCQKTIKNWVEKAPSEFWNQVQLVEVLLKGDPSPQSFCEMEKLPPTVCRKIISLTESHNIEQIFSELSFQGVPRVMVLDAQNKVALFEFPLERMTEYSNIPRDLSWMLEGL